MGQDMSFEDVMNMIQSVPSVAKSNDRPQLELAIAIQKKRLEMNLTQQELVKIIKANGHAITQATISKMESAEGDVKLSTYLKVTDALNIKISIAEKEQTRPIIGTDTIELPRKRMAAKKRTKVARSVGQSIAIKSPRIWEKREPKRVALAAYSYANRAIPKTYKGDYEEEIRELESMQ
ncbi:helix-turn-helix transcriptional regulator [Exiguobacterium sp.]|uniref:helix-turn-helix domain-containing protein n=1 Tax=Exiguobacterium sp. TaxID=44751 RepID=UPI0028AA00A0|nr:helix-turn-helix transcriptional regulator [Exiguobacterium sp.]